MTLQDLYDKHPEWRDHTLVIYRNSGYNYVNEHFLYENDEFSDEINGFTGRKLLVFSED